MHTGQHKVLFVPKLVAQAELLYFFLVYRLRILADRCFWR
jgi:hypothetical protein